MFVYLFAIGLGWRVFERGSLFSQDFLAILKHFLELVFGLFKLEPEEKF